MARLRAAGQPVWFGNAARPGLLRSACAAAAPAFVLIMGQPPATQLAVRGIRREFPHGPLFVRSRDERHARALLLAGASVVVPETLEASLPLSAFVREAVGLDARAVHEIVECERDLSAAGLPDPAPR